MKRSYEQLKLYHAYIKQLRALDVVKVQIGHKEWIGSLRNVRDARYLLKVLDLGLPTTNISFPEKSKNKNKFSDTEMNSLTHHISWLREVLYESRTIPFDDKSLFNEDCKDRE